MLQHILWSSADTSFASADCFAPFYQEVSDDQKSDFVFRLDALPGSYQEVSGNENSDFVSRAKCASLISSEIMSEFILYFQGQISTLETVPI